MTDDRELDVVRRLGAVAPFDEATDQRVRADIARRIGQAGDRVPEGLLAPGEVPVGAHGPRRPPSGRAAYWLVAAATLAVAAVGLVWLLGGGDEEPTLTDYADAVAQGEHVTIGPGEVLVVTERTTVPGLGIDDRVTRSRPDGSGTLEISSPDVDQPPAVNPLDQVAVGGMSYPVLQRLPSSPEELEVAVEDYERAAGLDLDRPGATSTLLIDLLGTPATPPGARASALLLLADAGAIADDVGGPQVVIEQDDSTLRASLDLERGLVTDVTVTDPATGEILSVRQFVATEVAPA